MTSRTEARPASWAAGGVATALWLCVSASASCIIPDHGIVALVDCGSRWCATADFAEAFDFQGGIVQVQETQPDGSSGWATGCVCMTPAEDLVLRSDDPPMQYELLRNQIIDAARQACLDAAIANSLDPDPPYPLDEQLDPSCYEAPALIFRDGCCKRLNTECGTNNSCDADLDPELLLAEGTSLRFATTSAGRPLGLEFGGVEPDTLAGHLGLRDHDILLRVDDLPLRTEAELLDAATFAQAADHLTVLVLRDGVVHEHRLVRER